MNPRAQEPIFQNLQQISWFWYEILFLWNTTLKPILCWIYFQYLWKTLYSFSVKKYFYNIGEKHIIHFMDVPVVFHILDSWFLGVYNALIGSAKKWLHVSKNYWPSSRKPIGRIINILKTRSNRSNPYRQTYKMDSMFVANVIEIKFW